MLSVKTQQLETKEAQSVRGLLCPSCSICPIARNLFLMSIYAIWDSSRINSLLFNLLRLKSDAFFVLLLNALNDLYFLSSSLILSICVPLLFSFYCPTIAPIFWVSLECLSSPVEHYFAEEFFAACYQRDTILCVPFTFGRLCGNFSGMTAFLFQCGLHICHIGLESCLLLAIEKIAPFKLGLPFTVKCLPMGYHFYCSLLHTF